MKRATSIQELRDEMLAAVNAQTTYHKIRTTVRRYENIRWEDVKKLSAYCKKKNAGFASASIDVVENEDKTFNAVIEYVFVK